MRSRAIAGAVGVLLTLVAVSVGEGAGRNAASQRRGFYLHGCWAFNYAFAVRTWQRADYQNMFRLLKRLGFDTVMLWPVLESVPAPLSDADRQAVREYRPIIEDARTSGLECWLTQCAAVIARDEIRAKPWMQRSLYAHMKTVRLDDPKQAAAYLKHRAALMEILKNANAYVTIDGDPGGYPGAKPADFLDVFLHDRQTIDRVGTHPKTQKVIPWIWCGWGTKGVWQEPIAPFVTATLDTLKRGMPEPWELLPGRSIREGHANGRINMDLAKEAGLLDRSTLLLYEIIEFEPTPPDRCIRLLLLYNVAPAKATSILRAHRGVHRSRWQSADSPTKQWHNAVLAPSSRSIGHSPLVPHACRRVAAALKIATFELPLPRRTGCLGPSVEYV